MSEEQAVIVERQGGVMVITLNRPDAMNAINGALSNGLWTPFKNSTQTTAWSPALLPAAVGHFAPAWI